MACWHSGHAQSQSLTLVALALIDYCVERWLIGVNYQPSIHQPLPCQHDSTSPTELDNTRNMAKKNSRPCIRLTILGESKWALGLSTHTHTHHHHHPSVAKQVYRTHKTCSICFGELRQPENPLCFTTCGCCRFVLVERTPTLYIYRNYNVYMV